MTDRDFDLHRTACGEVIQVAIEFRPLLYDGRAAHVSVTFNVSVGGARGLQMKASTTNLREKVSNGS